MGARWKSATDRLIMPTRLERYPPNVVHDRLRSMLHLVVVSGHQTAVPVRQEPHDLFRQLRKPSPAIVVRHVSRRLRVPRYANEREDLLALERPEALNKYRRIEVGSFLAAGNLSNKRTRLGHCTSGCGVSTEVEAVQDVCEMQRSLRSHGGKSCKHRNDVFIEHRRLGPEGCGVRDFRKLAGRGIGCCSKMGSRRNDAQPYAILRIAPQERCVVNRLFSLRARCYAQREHHPVLMRRKRSLPRLLRLGSVTA
jgi:hypothetical protein